MLKVWSGLKPNKVFNLKLELKRVYLSNARISFLIDEVHLRLLNPPLTLSITETVGNLFVLFALRYKEEAIYHFQMVSSRFVKVFESHHSLKLQLQTPFFRSESRDLLSLPLFPVRQLLFHPSFVFFSPLPLHLLF